MRRARILIAAAALLVGAILLFDIGDLLEPRASGSPHPNLEFTVAADRSGVVSAVGDIADCEAGTLWNRVVAHFDGRLAWAGIVGMPSQNTRQTARLIEQQPGIVLALGDIAYPDGEIDDFRDCFDGAWAQLVSRTYPVPGNHEYNSSAAGYRAYWGARAGPEAGLFYSFDYAGWHLVGLNSEIDAGPGSQQAVWLEADLAGSDANCIMAFDHRPAFSAVKRGGDGNALALFETLYRHGATLFLSGHNHFYERTTPLGPTGTIEEEGLRQFVVGTGGSPQEYSPEAVKFTEALITGRAGVLRLQLNQTDYDWAFLGAAGGAVIDSGKAACSSR